MRATALITLLAVLVGAIGACAAPAPSQVAAMASGNSPTPPPTVMPPTTPSPTPSPVRTNVSLSDPTGDMFDDAYKPARGPDFQDITNVRVTLDPRAGLIDLSTQVAGQLPASWDERSEQIIFGYYLETTGNGEADYQVILQNDVNETWTASLVDFSTGKPLSGRRFPGTAGAGADLAAVALSLAAIGNPREVRVEAVTAYTSYPDFAARPTVFTYRGDTAPKDIFPNGNGWLDFVVPTP